MRTPKVRFKIFNEDWHRVYLKEIADKVNNKNSQDKKLSVLTNSAKEGIVNQSEFFDREIVTKKNLKNYSLVDVNDFVYNPRISNSAPVGPLKRNKICEGLMSPLYTVFRFRDSNLFFMEHYFNSNVWHKYMRSIANFGARSDRMNITTSNFLNMPIYVPSNEEQQKITSFLTSVDEKINLLTKKKELLEQYKKGVMQKIFSQEIRFKNNNGNDFPVWEDVKMGDIIEFLSDYTANGSFASLKGNVTYYSSKNHAALVRTTDLEKRQFKPERFTDRRGYEFLNKTSLFGGEIIMANVGSVGNVYRTPNKYNGLMTLAPNTYLLKFKSNINEDFIYQLMTRKKFKNLVLSKVGSSTLKAINKSNLRSINISIPNINEQQKIAEFLSSLDKKIELVNSQINKTKEFKKGLLQQMFV